MIRSIPIHTAAAAILLGALPLAPSFAQAPAAPAAGASPAPAQASQAAATPAQPPRPAVMHQALTAAQRMAVRREHHMAQMRTATSELEAAISDMKEGRIVAARIALGHAETAALNEQEAAIFAGGEASREQAMSNVLGYIESARFNLRHDRAWSERMANDALRGLREAPRL